jgi:hypothetical protein
VIETREGVEEAPTPELREVAAHSSGRPMPPRASRDSHPVVGALTRTVRLPWARSPLSP